MATKIAFFPVGNGDMTLISLGDAVGTTILIDCNIREAADDPEDPTRDVAADLRQRLKPTKKGARMWTCSSRRTRTKTT